ncbi:MAG: PAS domain S-box protein [Deltaproteobacteria bacterium]|nr:PAS domain S-box protein [Deltaproteobacteria bacterium]
MSGQSPTLVEQNIQLILRGAAGVLGCRSATYLHVDDAARTVQIWTGLMQVTDDLPEKIESLFGVELGGGVLEWMLPKGSLVFESYRKGTIRETSSINELIGEALPPEISESLHELVGNRHFACVPVVGRAGPSGVILFEKKDENAFTPHQRELLLTSATRVGFILESERFAAGARRMLKDIVTRSIPESPLIRQALTRFLEDAAEAMISLDSAQTIVAVNTRAEEMFGQSLENLKDRAFEVLFVDAESSHRVLESRMHLISDGFFEMRPRLQRGDGTTFPAFLSGLVTVDEDGEAVGSIIRVRDLGAIDRRGQEEEDLRRRLVRSERLAMLGRMAAQMAHEIRNPLVSIGASLGELIADLEDGEIPRDDLKLELTSISEEVDRLDAILHDYLALARHPTIQPTRIRVGIVLEDAARIASQNPSARSSTIDVTLSGEDEVFADADALRQVFINLLLNALESSQTDTRVACRTSARDGRVITEIEDQGKGLPTEVDRERLFEPFFTTKTRGSGLGLAVTRKIVEDLGGKVTLEPAPGGRGTVARVTLPVPGRGRVVEEIA